jgi:putative protease
LRAKISVVQIQKIEKDLNKEKSELQDIMLDKIKHLNIDKIPLTLSFSGKLGDVFTVTVTTQEYVSSLLSTETKSFVLQSSSPLVKSEKLSLDENALDKRFRGLNNEEYDLQALNSDELDAGLTIPYKELTAIRKTHQFIQK